MADRPDHTDGRAAHELVVARGLVAALRAAGEDLDDPRARGAPDAVVSSPRGPIGIDVAEASYDEAPPPPGRDMPAPVGLADGSSDAALATHLNGVLQDHCRKAYGMPTYLVVDVPHTPLTDGADAPAVAAALTFPPDCRFARIFLRMSAHAGGDPALFEVHRPRPDGPVGASGAASPAQPSERTPRAWTSVSSWRK